MSSNTQDQPDCCLAVAGLCHGKLRLIRRVAEWTQEVGSQASQGQRRSTTEGLMTHNRRKTGASFERIWKGKRRASLSSRVES